MLYNLSKLSMASLSKMTMKNVAIRKVTSIFFTFLVFGIIYTLFCYDYEFGGINLIQDELKKKLVDTYVEKVKKRDITTSEQSDIANKLHTGEIDTEEDLVLKAEIDTETLNVDKNVTGKNIFQQFFDRFYFAVVTGTTLGYGDIYPVSNKVKVLSILQLFATIYILVT